MIQELGTFLKEVKQKKSLGEKVKYLLYRLSRKLITSKMLRRFYLEDHYNKVYDSLLDFKRTLKEDLINERDFKELLARNMPEEVGGYYGIKYKRYKRKHLRYSKVESVSDRVPTKKEADRTLGDYDVIIFADKDTFLQVERIKQSLEKTKVKTKVKTRRTK